MIFFAIEIKKIEFFFTRFKQSFILVDQQFNTSPATCLCNMYCAELAEKNEGRYRWAWIKCFHFVFEFYGGQYFKQMLYCIDFDRIETEVYLLITNARYRGSGGKTNTHKWISVQLFFTWLWQKGVFEIHRGGGFVRFLINFFIKKAFIWVVSVSFLKFYSLSSSVSPQNEWIWVCVFARMCLYNITNSYHPHDTNLFSYTQVWMDAPMTVH